MSAKDKLRQRILEMTSKDASSLPIEARKRSQYSPLSFAQQRLWFMQQLLGPNSVYNMPFTFRLSGSLNTRSLLDSLERVVERHEILRTRVIEHNGQWMQVIDPAGPSLVVEEVQGFDSIEQLCREERTATFDMTQGSLIRIRLLHDTHEKSTTNTYLLVVTMHHSVSDAWSVGVFINEMVALYQSYNDGKDDELKPLPIQYLDYAHWQREKSVGPLFERQIEYWRQTLDGLPSLISLPTDWPRPQKQSYRGRAYAFDVDETLSNQIAHFAKSHNTTVFSVLLAAYYLVLSRYSGQRDIAIGTPVANREKEETQQLIGFFVNTLVLRCRPEADSRVSELVSMLKKVTLEAFSNQDIPFEMLVERLNPQRSLGHAPLFQVMFSLQNAPSTTVSLPGLELRPYDGDSEHSQESDGFARFDLNLNMRESETGFSGLLEYCADLYSTETVQRMAIHFEHILKLLVKKPDARCRDLELLNVDQKTEMLERLNNTSAPIDVNVSVHQLVQNMIEERPDSIAIVYESIHLSYCELERRANNLACQLQGTGVQPATRVGVYLHRSHDIPVSLYAILKLGAAYVPLDPDMPQARLRHVIADSRLSHIVTHTEARQNQRGEDSLNRLLKGLDGDSLTIVDMMSASTNRRTTLSTAVCPDQEAYVIYTSGSTGVPKGVSLSHRNTVNFLSTMAKCPGMQSTDRLLAVTTLSFDIAFLEMFLPLITGGCVDIASRDLTRHGALLNSRVVDSRISILQATPATWKLMLSSGRCDFPALTALVGGESFPQSLVEQLLPRVMRIWNMYGPTETCVWSAIHQVRSSSPVTPIGRPIENTEIYILDQNGQLCPAGAIGEIHIGGTGVATAYEGLAALTAQRFVPDIFGQHPGRRLYATGDLGRLVQTSSKQQPFLECLGRIDYQVKIRGFRIELGEIESVLATSNYVSSVAVVVHQLPANEEKRLVACIARANACSLSELELIDNLKRLAEAKLPNYMLPSGYSILDQLPLTKNGKVDRSKLQSVAPLMDQTEYVEPIDEIEIKLARLWSELLAVENIGRTHNFFLLGGHSLLATQLLSRVRDIYSVELGMQAVFESQDLQSMADRIRLLAPVDDPERAPIGKAPSDSELVMSPAQKRLWFLSQYMGPSAVYNIPLALKIEGKINHSVLIESLNQIVNRHAVLRTRFVADGHLAAPIVDEKFSPIEVEEVDSHDEFTDIYWAERSYCFDLSTDTLCRIRLVNVKGESDCYLLVIMHHSISDAWSVGVFFRELVSHYTVLADGKPVKLDELPIQYSDYAHWQVDYLRNETIQQQLDFWTDKLGSLPRVLNLPTDRQRPEQQSYRGGACSIVLPEALTSDLNDFSRDNSATLFMVLLSAFSVLMHRYANQAKFGIGVPIANRTRAETENLIGFFVNTLVLPFNFSNDPSYRSVLEQTKLELLQAHENQDIPFEQLVEELSPERSLSHSPLFQVMFSLQNVPVSGSHLEGVRFSALELGMDGEAGDEGSVSRFDLTMNLHEIQHRVEGIVEYNVDLFDRQTIEHMVIHFEQILRSVVADSVQPVSAIQMIDGTELHWLESALTPPAALTRGESAATLLRNQLSQESLSPLFEHSGSVDNLVVFGQIQLVSQTLTESPACRTSVAAVCVRDTQTLVAAVIGVIQAGWTPLVIDYSAPLQRKHGLVESSGASFVLFDDVRQQSLVSGSMSSVLIDAEVGSSVLSLGNAPSNAVAMLLPSSDVNGTPQIAKVSMAGLTQLLSNPVIRDQETTNVINVGVCWLELDVQTFIVLQCLSSIVQGRELPAVEHLYAHATKAVAQLKSANGFVQKRGTSDACVLHPNQGYAPRGTLGELCLNNSTGPTGFVDVRADEWPNFVPNDVMRRPSGRFLRSGLVARVRHTGDLEVIASLQDTQDHSDSIARTQRKLMSCEMLADVELLEQGEGVHRQVMCLYQPATAETVDQTSAAALIGAWIRRQPDALLLPTRYHQFDRLPRKSSGQIDLAQIPVSSFITINDQFSVPRGETEQLLATLWREVLEPCTIGRDSDFFELGGHSLLTAQLVSRIREAFGVEVSVRQLFEAQSLREQAQVIKSARKGTDGSHTRIARIDRSAPMRLSYAQERLWFLNRLMGPNSVYNMFLPLRLEGEVNLDALVSSITYIVRRHETLRTRFERIDGFSVQIIEQEELELSVETVEDDNALYDIAQHERHYTFDLGKERHCRIRLLHHKQDDYYVLLTCMHHSVTDAWSLGIYLQELVENYQSFDLNINPSATPLDVQYADFASWQRKHLNDDSLNKDVEYWLEQLKGLPPLLALPTDYTRPAEQSFRGDVEAIKLPADLSTMIGDFCAEYNVTPYMLLLSVFSVLLGRYSGQTDISIGTPFANRSRKETEKLIGFFVGNLVMRSDLSDDPTFAEHLIRVRETALSGYAHQEVPFEKLVESLNPSRSRAYTPLFQVTFTLQNVPVDSASLPALKFKPLELPSPNLGSPETEQGVSRFDLSLIMQETPEGLEGRMEYSTDLFKSDRIKLMIAHYAELLRAAMSEPHKRISALKYLSEAEYQQQVDSFNDTRVEVPAFTGVHEMFEHQVNLTPETIAVSYENEALTYVSLDKRSNQLAHLLRAQGVDCEHKIGICMQRSIDMVVVLFGVLKSGACYVPLSSDLPVDRMKSIMEAAQMATVITHSETSCQRILDECKLDESFSQSLNIINLDRLSTLSDCPDSKPPTTLNSSNLAYVMFTSGSTGIPKGVPIDHSAAINFVHWMQNNIPLERSDNLLQKTPFNFDISIPEFFWTLAYGAKLVMLRPGGHVDPELMRNVIARQHITTLHFVPSMLNTFLNVTNWIDCESISQVMVGGEALTYEVQQRFFTCAPEVGLEDLYGPTEATVDVSSWRCTPDSDLPFVPIGKAMQNVRLYITDSNLQLMPLSCVGELMMGGVALSRGYLNRPGRTAESFIPDPFSGQPGERLYRSGDLARFLPDGTVQYLGRIGSQIKLRGYRIEMLEIEFVLNQHPDVSHCVVVFDNQTIGMERLIAYVVVKPTSKEASKHDTTDLQVVELSDSQSDDLQVHMRTKLSEYMIPSVIIALNFMPVTKNGKVDRSVLPDPHELMGSLEVVAPKTPTEQTLVGLWSDVLQVESVSTEADFFHLGGHSLLAVQLLSDIHTEFDVDIPIRMFFENPTIVKIANTIDVMADHGHDNSNDEDVVDSIEI